MKVTSFFSPSSIARLVATALLLWGLARHPYGYYKLLRWVVCGAGAYSAFVTMSSKKSSWAWALGITAAVFNPIFPIHLERATWAVLNIAAAILFGASIFAVREHRQAS
jgi:FtsH-binding integral membrane protein